VTFPAPILFSDAAPAQRRDLFSVFGKQLTELPCVEPNAAAGRATVHGHTFNEKFAKTLSVALRTFHDRALSRVIAIASIFVADLNCKAFGTKNKAMDYFSMAPAVVAA
jgi:hypothetical protein